MDVVVLKYVQILCFSMFMGNNANCAQLMSTSEQMTNLKVSVCAAKCLSGQINNVTRIGNSDHSSTDELSTPHRNLTSCYQSCVNQPEKLDDVRMVENTDGTGFTLYCRDSVRLVIQFEQNKSDGHVANEKLIYLLVIQESTMKFVDRYIYISDEPMIELRDLEPSESYNVSATIVSSSKDVRVLGMQKFTTLREKYVPEDVTDIWVDEEKPVGDGEHVNVVVKWKNARDRTCLCDVVFHDNGMNSEILVFEKASPNLYSHKLENLAYDTHYSVGIRGLNAHHRRLESIVRWYEFTTKSCKNSKTNNCRPKPKFWFTVNVINVYHNIFRFNITVNTTDLMAEYYRMEVRDINKKLEDAWIEEFDGNLTTFISEKFTIEGSECWVNLTAFYDNGENYIEGFEVLKVDHLKGPRSMFMSFFIYTLFIIASLVLVLSFLAWQGRINFYIKSYTQKQLDNMDLDLIKSISNRTILEAIADLTRDDVMEVERENITLLEALGEGAFGLVKRATVVRGGEDHQVAVKMLKNTANIDDIKQFHQEISVMKSVGKHPNIVSIIGHCTSNIEELMLLTEFCDAGSLLDLLRSEFARQLSFYDKKISKSPQKYPDSMHNFDSDEKNLSYKNFGCSSRLFVVNQMYDDLNQASHQQLEMHQRQAPLKAIKMTATNALYLQLSDNDPKPLIIEIPEKEETEKFLTSGILVSFAKQVADGMDFLARKKVVHRDLAARNVLVCSDKSVKIADFGLSRDIYQDNIYRKVGNGKLPIKWLAIESMTHQVYTSQSDVWSFGILLYEIVTLGATPYPSIGAEQLMKILHTGYRMEKPRHCHPSLYDVMLSCWTSTPTERPAFEELSDKLNQFLKMENSWDDRFIDLPKLFDKCTSEMNYMKPIA